MVCNEIVYTNFRNIVNSTIPFQAAVNIFYGSNAAGKTNALEGIYLFAQGKSFRTGREKDLIRFGEDFAEISLKFTDCNRTQQLNLRYHREKRRECHKNGVLLPRLADFIGAFRAVLFCPEHLSLVKEGASIRRNFMDVALSQMKPSYLYALQKYQHLLEQRNALLKNATGVSSAFSDTIALWSEQLAIQAAFLTVERRNYVHQLDGHVSNFFADMTNSKEKSSLVYTAGVDADADIAQIQRNYAVLLTNNLPREIMYRSTLYGAHKDDIRLFLNEREARVFASQGQQRSLALAMKLGEGEISKETTGEYPVFLFDDVLSELDVQRQQYVLKELENRQVILTSCDCGSFSPIADANQIYVENGSYYQK